MFHPLKVTSIQSPNADATCRQITRYLSEQLGVAAEFVGDVPWQERERRLDVGEIHLGWICGLPYVHKVDTARLPLELAAAPVMRHPRYRQQPIYFSDVIVHRDSRFRSFADLRGATWAYNEPHSQSGYNITRYHLATLAEYSGFFGRVIEAGAHLTALEMVLDRRIDAAAIDSTVLELELAARPQLGEQLRVIDILGPSPIPPWVLSKNIAPPFREAIRQALWQMHATPTGQAILSEGQILKLVRVEDRDYDLIRKMARLASQVSW